MGRFVIAVYRPRPGMEAQLLASLPEAQNIFSAFEALAPAPQSIRR